MLPEMVPGWVLYVILPVLAVCVGYTLLSHQAVAESKVSQTALEKENTSLQAKVRELESVVAKYGVIMDKFDTIGCIHDPVTGNVRYISRR